jgi:serine/threonine-protein kinase
MESMKDVLNERYRMETKLGHGGMAIVYQATDLMLERVIAVKLLKEDFSSSPAFQERFKQEAKAAANLSHPNIVTIHDFGLDQKRLFIVMEYVPGTDLKQRIKETEHGLSIENASRLFIQACAGVGYAHRAGLVHCDIKPHNMLITPDNRLKVTDFGIARALASINPDEITNAIWGSPTYFSPEQAAGAPPSPASDVYSLGVVLYEMVTGRLPFPPSNPEQLALDHRHKDPPSPREFNPRISKELERIILKVLSKEPSKRYRTADQLGRIMINFTQSKKQESQDRASPHTYHLDYSPLAKKEQASLDWITILVGLLALIAVGGLIPFWMWVYFQINP